MVKKYIKKPVVIKALQWTGSNRIEIQEFLDGAAEFQSNNLFIDTLEGMMRASVGDFIIEGVAGEFYPCKPEIFERSYNEYKSI